MAELSAEPGTYNVREDITDQTRRDVVATMAGRTPQIEQNVEDRSQQIQTYADAAKTASGVEAMEFKAQDQEIQGEADKQIGYMDALGSLYQDAAASAIKNNQQFADDWNTVVTATNRALDEYAAELLKQQYLGRGGRGGGRGRGGGGGGGGDSVVDLGVSTPQWIETFARGTGEGEIADFNSYLGTNLFSRGIVGSHLVEDRAAEIDSHYTEGENAPYTDAAYQSFMETYRNGGTIGEAAASTLQGLLSAGVPPDFAAELVQLMSATWADQWEAADRFATSMNSGPGIRSGPWTGYAVAAPAYANPQAQGGPPNTRTDTPPPPDQTAGAAYGGPPDTRQDVQAEQDTVTRNSGPV